MTAGRLRTAPHSRGTPAARFALPAQAETAMFVCLPARHARRHTWPNSPHPPASAVSARAARPRAYSRPSAVRDTLETGPNLALSVLDLSETGARLVVNESLEPGRRVYVNLEGRSGTARSCVGAAWSGRWRRQTAPSASGSISTSPCNAATSCPSAEPPGAPPDFGGGDGSPSPLYAGARGWGEGEISSGDLNPLTPDPSPPSTGERGEQSKIERGTLSRQPVRLFIWTEAGPPRIYPARDDARSAAAWRGPPTTRFPSAPRRPARRIALLTI